MVVFKGGHSGVQEERKICFPVGGASRGSFGEFLFQFVFVQWGWPLLFGRERGGAEVEKKGNKKRKRKGKGKCGLPLEGFRGANRAPHFWIHLKYIFILKLVYPHYSYDFAIFHEWNFLKL